jgi:hypothetical protein
VLELIPNWKAWYKRWSTWLLALVATINVNDILGFMPSIQEFVEPQTYKLIMLGLSVATFLALQVKQVSVSGPSA